MMKWSEPWVQMLRRQATFNPFTKPGLKRGAIWSAMLLALGFANALMSDQAPIGMVERMPIVIALGFSLATLIDFWHWVSPQSISSGPNGIVRSKGDTHTLIPWTTVLRHQFIERGGVLVLELSVCYQPEPEVLYLRADTDIRKISDEIESMTGQRC